MRPQGTPFAVEPREQHECARCGVRLLPCDYYRVRNEVWLEARLLPSQVVHSGCLVKFLDRPLTLEDLFLAPLRHLS